MVRESVIRFCCMFKYVIVSHNSDMLYDARMK